MKRKAPIGRKKDSTVDKQSQKLQKVQAAPIEDLQALDRIPADAAACAALNKFWEPQIRLWVEDRLSPGDCAMLKRHAKNLDALPRGVSLRCFAALDEIIFEQARVIGPRIFFFPEFVNPLLRWEKERKGPEKLERLGKELALGAAVSQGRKKMPLDPKMRVLRKELIPEVKMLRDLLKSRFTQRSFPEPEKLLRTAVAIVRDRGQPFERLWAGATPLERFIRKEAAVDRQWLYDLVCGKITPAAFVDGWLALATNRSEEALRQAIAGMTDGPVAPDAR